VSNLLLMASMASGVAPEVIADEIGDGGGGALKARVTEDLNTMLAPIRARRAELEKNEDYLIQILREGNERANEVANETLADVIKAMHMDYV